MLKFARSSQDAGDLEQWTDRCGDRQLLKSLFADRQLCSAGNVLVDRNDSLFWNVLDFRQIQWIDFSQDRPVSGLRIDRQPLLTACFNSLESVLTFGVDKSGLRNLKRFFRAAWKFDVAPEWQQAAHSLIEL